jgi:Putative lumazine-binding
MKKVFTILAVLIFSKMSYAQNIQGSSDTAAIKQTINTLFDGMRKGDSTLSGSVFSKGMIFHQRISNDKNGKVTLSTENAGDIVKRIGTPHALVYDERVVYDAIKIDGDLACVWVPYRFYLGDQFSHCGVDVFQLMRTADGWKVIYLVDTLRKDNCIP